ncbi:MAG: hypothetical protein NPIRA03_06560 [Nitrospirales bacterium]|nr:MAG: hypothetical protein NPIRA03_06560 [Nitrospirales bacterium]
MTHDFKHHGTVCRLKVLQGLVIGQCYKRHRHQEFLKFLRHPDQEFPGETPSHLVMDNDGTHAYQCKNLARTASPLPPLLCADQFQLAQSHRLLGWETDLQESAAEFLLQRKSFAPGDHGVPVGVE